MNDICEGNSARGKDERTAGRSYGPHPGIPTIGGSRLTLRSGSNQKYPHRHRINSATVPRTAKPHSVRNDTVTRSQQQLFLFGSRRGGAIESLDQEVGFLVRDVLKLISKKYGKALLSVLSHRLSSWYSFQRRSFTPFQSFLKPVVPLSSTVFHYETICYCPRLRRGR
jgi:hypothetical protein